VVRNADEVFVRVNSKRVVGTKAFRTSSLGAQAKEPPLAFVHLEGVEFTPLKFDKAVQCSVGDPVLFYGLGLYEEMGRDVRRVGTTVKSVGNDGTPRLADGLLAGEAAGPVIRGDGRLVTFLAGKTDVQVGDGGKGLPVSPDEIAKLIARITGGSYSSSGYGQIDRKASAPPLAAKGHAFVVYATSVEKVE
ncbi:MAG TPA: hypothetical protein VM098_08690, partial [Phycisphaerae bacterium]|nr:hypothetical protein [Phycisphaerae bacterium]